MPPPARNRTAFTKIAYQNPRRPTEIARNKATEIREERIGRKNCLGGVRLDAADAVQSEALYVAGGTRRPAHAPRLGKLLPDRLQAGAGGRPLFLQMGDRRPGRRCAQPAAAARLPAGAGGTRHCLQCRADRPGRAQPVARRAVCQRRPACGAQARLQNLRPHARTIAALPSRAAHRRPVAHHRARREGHRDDRALHRPGNTSDHSRIRS